MKQNEAFNFQIDKYHMKDLEKAVINITNFGVVINGELVFKGKLSQNLIKGDFTEDTVIDGFISNVEVNNDNKNI